MKKFISLLLLSLTLALALTACGQTISDEDAIAIVKDRIIASYALNEIYFGEGLPTEEYEDNGEAIQYVNISSDSPYHTVDAIKMATEDVYSPRVCGNLYANAFTGFNDGQVVVYARYIEQYGILTANVKYSTIKTTEDYDLSSVKVIENKKNYVVFEILKKDGSVGTVEITLSGDGRWTLNTLTY